MDIDGRRVLDRCRRLRCESCGPYEAGLLRDAIVEARTRWFIRLKHVGDNWPSVHYRMNKIAETLHSMVEFEWVWVVHENLDRDDPGFHVHALAKGEPLALDVLMIVASHHDLWAEPLYNVQGAASYVLRQALDGGARLDRFLDVNGGRQFAHWSRGFFPDGKEAAVDRVRSRRSALPYLITVKRPDLITVKRPEGHQLRPGEVLRRSQGRERSHACVIDAVEMRSPVSRPVTVRFLREE